MKKCLKVNLQEELKSKFIIRSKQQQGKDKSKFDLSKLFHSTKKR